MKSFVILGFLAAVLSFAEGADYKEALLEIKETFPGLISTSPEVIEVVYDNGAFLDLGKNITPTEAKNQPIVVNWNAEKNTYYTLMIVDPDAPNRENNYLKDVLTWLVGNIPENNISAGDVLVEYVGTAPPKNMGPNRYFFLLFKQSGKLDFNEKRVDKYTIDGRLNFSTRNFIEKYRLGPVIGVNFETSYYDPQTDALYKELNCCEELYEGK